MSRLSRSAGLLALSVFFLSAASCEMRTVSKSAVSTTIGDRTVKASSDGGAFVSTKGDTAIFDFGSHKVTVEDERLLLDGVEVAKFSGEAKRVEIAVSEKLMTINVDGKQVLQKAVD